MIYSKYKWGKDLVEKANSKIINEEIILHNAYNKELEGYSDKVYSRYHQNNADWYGHFSGKIHDILGITGEHTILDFASEVATMNITQEQNKALADLRREPKFIRLMGETALEHKADLEKLLGGEISSAGKTFADENGPKVAVKSEEQLEQELNNYSDKMSGLLTSGTITEAQYDENIQNLDYIYSYYVSCSKGEQIPFRQMTNKEYEQIEQRADENNVSFSEQLKDENDVLKFEHEDLQELQG